MRTRTCQCYIIKANRSQVRQSIYAGLRLIRNHPEWHPKWTALRHKRFTGRRSDEMCKIAARRIEERLLCWAVPTNKEANFALIPTKKATETALRRASDEITYVFGILGFSPKTFVDLVNKVGFESLEDVLDVFDNLEDILDRYDMPIHTGSTLYHFCSWYIRFENTKMRKPCIIKTEFNELVWRQLCQERPDRLNMIRRIQPNRSCKIQPLFLEQKRLMNFGRTYYYLLYNVTDMINRARQEMFTYVE